MLQFRQGGIGIQASGWPRNMCRWSPFMAAPYPRIVLIAALVLSFLVCTVNAGAEVQQHAPRKRPVKQEPPPAPAPELPPPPPPTLQQMPAVPPKVSFTKGLLTIVAENSTLGDVLRAVRTQTGATVEVPPNATERVVAHLGPGVPREVLASLLNGSHFNYVMLGSPTNPDKVDRIILTSKSGSVPDTGSATPAQNNTAAAPPVPMDEPDTPAGADNSDQATEGSAEDSGAEEVQPPPSTSGQPQIKTPEQLLRELQQQQQQQQQQQGAGAGQPPK
jgi:hypothetical protein